MTSSWGVIVSLSIWHLICPPWALGSDPTRLMLPWQATRCCSKWLKMTATCVFLFPNPESVKADVPFPSSSRYPVFFSPSFNFVLGSILFNVYEIFLSLCKICWHTISEGVIARSTRYGLLNTQDNSNKISLNNHSLP